jgi:hypothetical protein
MNTISLHPDMIPMRDPSKIEDGDRLFWEYGYKRNPNIYEDGDKCIKPGKFLEFPDPMKYLEREPLLINPEFCEHHNFMIIKKK